MLLINALVDPDAVEDLDIRVALRNQLYQAGLTRILDKMEPLPSELLRRKMEEFKDLEEHDAALIYGDMVLNDVIDPPEILDNILASVVGTEAYESLRSILQHLMLVQGETATRDRCYQLIESVVSRIVLQQNADDVEDTSMTVDALISKFAEETELDQALREADLGLPRPSEASESEGSTGKKNLALHQATCY